jgi:hypothetical protein
MRIRLLLLSVLIIIILLLNFISASFSRGANPYNLTILGYATSSPVLGWINISITNEPANSLLKGFNTTINLKDFLDNNSAIYTCSPVNCQTGYSSLGNPMTTKTVSLNYDKQYVGIRLTGLISAINSLSFNVASNAQESCSITPLKMSLLDDETLMYNGYGITNALCGASNNTGCFDPLGSMQTAPIANQSSYCENINVFQGKGFRLGANINGSGTAKFQMTMTVDGQDEKTCDITTSSGGEIGCNVILDNPLEDITPAVICLSPTDLSGSYYTIQYEDSANNTCGYVTDSNGGTYNHDFNLFVYPLKYSAVPSFIFNQDFVNNNNLSITLTDYISSYLADKYENNCTPDCIIPIGLSGIQQDLTLSNLVLSYDSSGIQKTENSFVDIKNTSSLISADFQILDLSKANILVPSKIGIRKLILTLGGNEIFRTDIQISTLSPEIENNNSNIIDIIPHNPPALIQTSFAAFTDINLPNASYSWDFGDGSNTVTTKTNVVKHTYSNGSYYMTLTILFAGYTQSKTVQITTSSPKNYINQTIAQMRSDLNNLENDVTKQPDFIRNGIYKKIGSNYFSDTKSSIQKLEEDYKQAFSNSDDTKSIEIMNNLIKLDIPYKTGFSQQVQPVEYVFSPTQIDIGVLDSLGAGKYGGTNADYADKLNKWINDNLKITFESKTYTLSHRDLREETLFSYLKFTVEPKQQDLQEIYFIINGNPDNILINWADTKDVAGKAKSIRFPSLSETKTIEVLYPDKIDFSNVPAYISPEVRKIGIATAVVGSCNNNKVCESDLGENTKNCPNDCTSWMPTIILLAILLFVALIIYLILQEWYKRHYEAHLFANKNQLFNLINFMNTSISQGMKKNDIYSKLKERGWNHEQLDYAWNKLHGKRTGMWEIPLFKWVENKEVKRELEKRGSTLNNMRNYPR